jgi:hypothetical protein
MYKTFIIFKILIDKRIVHSYFYNNKSITLKKDNNSTFLFP